MRVRCRVSRLLFQVVVALGLAGCPLSWGQLQTRPTAFAGVDVVGNATTVEAALRTMSAQAAVIFVGTVTDVRRRGGEGFPGVAGVVEISFLVERGISGSTDGSTYVLKEWGGLWAPGEQRYKTGARLLMFLHAPSAFGLSSPVGGMDGAISIVGSSPVVEEGEGTEAVNAPTADLRWLAAKLGHPQHLKQANTSTPDINLTGRAKTLEAEKKLTAASKARPAPEEGDGSVSAVESKALQSVSVPAAQASVATILTMMDRWSKEASDAR